MTSGRKKLGGGIVTAVLLWAVSGCQPSVGETTASDATLGQVADLGQAGQAGEKQSAAPAESPELAPPQTRNLSSVDLLSVEDFSAMSTQELFDSVRTLQRHVSCGDSEAAREADYGRSRRKILEIAAELLSRKLEERLRYGAVLVQFDTLSELVNIDAPDAIDDLERLATGYLVDRDPDIVRVAREHLLMLETLRLATGVQVDTDELTMLLRDYIAAAQATDRRLTHADLMMLRQVATELEAASRHEAAGRVYELAGSAFIEAETEAVRTAAEQIAANGKKRLGLVGQTLEVAGVQLDGSAFDWSQYEGKVVLVDFWASWCGPCVREFPALKQMYERYRQQGFEIVGICLDEEPGPAERAVSLFKLPWPILYSQDEQQRGWNDPRAVRCGVNSLPAMFLLDRQGRVVSLSARGERLEALLEEMLAD